MNRSIFNGRKGKTDFAGTAVASQGRAMEADTISKNGLSMKNHYNRRIFAVNILLLLFVVFAVPMCGCDCNSKDCDYDCDSDCDFYNPNATVNEQQSIRESLETLKNTLEYIKTNFPGMDTSDIEAQIESLENLLNEQNQNNPDCIPFYSVVIVRWDSNTLTVINNPDNNGGYDFSSATYQWYYNGKKLRNSTGQSLLRNPDGGMLEAGHYHVEIRFSGGLLITCMEYCEFENSY